MRHKGLDHQTAKLSGFLALNHLTAKDAAKLPPAKLKKLKVCDYGMKGTGIDKAKLLLDLKVAQAALVEMESGKETQPDIKFHLQSAVEIFAMLLGAEQFTPMMAASMGATMQLLWVRVIIGPGGKPDFKKPWGGNISAPLPEPMKILETADAVKILTARITNVLNKINEEVQKETKA